MSDDLRSPHHHQGPHPGGEVLPSTMMGGAEGGHDPHGGYPGGYPGQGPYPHHPPPSSRSPYPPPHNSGYGGPPYGNGGPNGPSSSSGGPPSGPPGGNGGPYSQPYGGYSPHMHPPSQYGYPGYGPPPQGYPPYGGGTYPTQQPQETTSPAKGRRKSPNRSTEKKASPPQRSPSPSKPMSDTNVSNAVGSNSMMTTEMENARIREMTGGQDADGQQIIEVKPMRSDFHFFLDDVGSKIRSEAEFEVRKSYDNPDDKTKHFLLNTNLNSRLMRAWEDTTQERRDEYMIKEEDDRQRYIQDDEIASRHCATLTARAKGPKTPQGVDCDGANDEEEEKKKRSSPTNSIHSDESPTKRSRQMPDIAPAKEEHQDIKQEPSN